MIKFDHDEKRMYTNGKDILPNEDFIKAPHVCDTDGIYAILDINWSSDSCFVAEVTFDDSDNESVIDTFLLSFSTISKCELM